MKQTLFEERYGPRWAEFERWLSKRRHPQKKRPTSRRHAAKDEGTFADVQFPERYRELCQHLALARDRQYSPELVEHLNRLALSGHHILYSSRSRFGASVVEYVRIEFPRLVRAEWKLVLVASLLLFGPLILMSVIVPHNPQAAHLFLAPEQMAELRSMYADSERIVQRKADSDVAAFGFYVWNNVSIDFRTFASGLVFGLGTIAVLLYNGVFIGTVQGYLVSVGLGENLLQFVAGHSALELIAAALSGVAGLKLGQAVIAPGQRSRKHALVEAARVAIRILYGAAAMTLLAAFIEAFWSAHRYVSIPGKYYVGIVLWILVIAYFVGVGRQRPASIDAPVERGRFNAA